MKFITTNMNMMKNRNNTVVTQKGQVDLVVKDKTIMKNSQPSVVNTPPPPKPKR